MKKCVSTAAAVLMLVATANTAELHQSEALMAALAHPQSSYSGRLSLTHWSGGQSHVEDVNVFFSPPDKYRWEFLTPDGQVDRIIIQQRMGQSVFQPQIPMTHRRRHQDHDDHISKEEEWKILNQNYDISSLGSESILGLTAWGWTLVPHIPGKAVQTLWIDSETHIPIENKRMLRGDSDHSISQSRFSRLNTHAALSDELFQIENTPSAMANELDLINFDRTVLALRSKWIVLKNLPGGFVFDHARLLSVRQSPVWHLKYTDGLTPLSLFISDQPFRSNSLSQEPESNGMPPFGSERVYHGETRGKHYTLISEINNPLLQEIGLHLEKAQAVDHERTRR